MKERSVSCGESYSLPGGRAILITWLIFSFISTLKPQETEHISRMGFIGTTGKVLSKDPAYPGLNGPIYTGKQTGWFAGAFAEKHFGLRELQVWGGAIALQTRRMGCGMGYAGSLYDGRGIQRIGMSTMLRGKAVSGSVQLNAQKIHLSVEGASRYAAYSALALAVKIKPEIILGCLWQAPEAWFQREQFYQLPKSLIVCEIEWRPDEKVTLNIQIAKGRSVGLSCAADISLTTRTGWELGAGGSSQASLYHLYLVLPLKGMRWRIAVSHHRFLGASPATELSGYLKRFSQHISEDERKKPA